MGSHLGEDFQTRDLRSYTPRSLSPTRATKGPSRRRKKSFFDTGMWTLCIVESRTSTIGRNVFQHSHGRKGTESEAVSRKLARSVVYSTFRNDSMTGGRGSKGQPDQASITSLPPTHCETWRPAEPKMSHHPTFLSTVNSTSLSVSTTTSCLTT